MKNENVQDIRKRVLEQKRGELANRLSVHLANYFTDNPELRELRLTARELIRMIRSAGMPVWTWTDSQLAKLVHDTISNGVLPGRNEFGSDGRRTGNFIFIRRNIA